MKQILLLLTASLLTIGLSAQVTIGSAKEPVDGALLMLDDGTTGTANQNAKKGLGLPRVELQDYKSLQMGVAHNPELDGKELEHAGLVVYNLNSGLCKPGSGMHVWNGSEWNPLATKPINTRVAPGPSAVYAPNTYIGTGHTNVIIPVEKAFAIWDWWGSGDHPEEGKLLAETSTDFTGSLSVQVIWEEDEYGNSSVGAGGIVVGTPTLNKTTLDRTAIITVPITGTVGNAVVSLSDAKGVRWSWHIWVPNTDPTTNGAVTYAHNNGEQTYIFMDRNLGATRNGILEADRPYTMGMHYQWGRKDPFPGYLKLNGSMATDKVPTNIPVALKPIADAQTSVETGKSTTLTYAIQNPLDFISFAAGSWDWYTTKLGGLIWGSRWGDAIDPCDKNYRYTYKSEMDPCPAGWRVPSFSGHDKLFLVAGENVITDPRSPYLNNGVASTLKENYTGNSFDLGFDFQTESYKLGWFPAAGYRGSNNAELYPIETSHPARGHYWTSSHAYNAYSSQYMSMEPDAIVPWENTGRAQGQSVRCVKD